MRLLRPSSIFVVSHSLSMSTAHGPAVFRSLATSSSSSAAPGAVFAGCTFHDLRLPPAQLRADFTLIMGQCFNWRKLPLCAYPCWVGCLGDEPIAVLSTDSTTYAASLRAGSDSSDGSALRDKMRAYFQADHDLEALYAAWAAGCPRMQEVTARLPGVRVVQQDPFECLVSFICSSNNNIKRITQMLDKLKARYGTYVCSIAATDGADGNESGGEGSSEARWRVYVEPPDRVAEITAQMLAPASSSSSSSSSSAAAVTDADHDHDDDRDVDDDLMSPPAAAAQGTPSSSTGKASRKRARPAAGAGTPDDVASPVAAPAVAPAFTTHHFFAFPTVASLAAATEADLRALGMGYRAKFIKGTAELVAGKPGGAQWLMGLRAMAHAPQEGQQGGDGVKIEGLKDDLEEEEEKGDDGGATGLASSRLAVQALLCECPGIGRKVADCVALFALDQTESIPVDTHVWDICCRDYDPTGALRAAKSLTPTVYERVGDAFRSRFGAKAGWAHSVLFAAELPEFRRLLPEARQAEMRAFAEEERQNKAAKRAQAAANKKTPSPAAAAPLPTTTTTTPDGQPGSAAKAKSPKKSTRKASS